MKMKKLAALALSAAMVLAVSAPAYAAWTVLEDGNAYYNNETTGDLVTNNWVQNYDHTWSAVDADGWCIRGAWVLSHDGYMYYNSEYGTMNKGGLYNIPAATYYYDMQDGKYESISIEGGTYYFDDDGRVMV